MHEVITASERASCCTPLSVTEIFYLLVQWRSFVTQCVISMLGNLPPFYNTFLTLCALLATGIDNEMGGNILLGKNQSRREVNHKINVSYIRKNRIRRHSRYFVT